MIYPRLSILVTIPTLGSAHSLRKVNCCLSFHCSWTVGRLDLKSLFPETDEHFDIASWNPLGWNQTQRSQIRSTSHQQQPNNVMPPCMHLHWPWPARAPSNWLAACGSHGPHPRMQSTLLLAASTGRPRDAICKLHSGQIYIYLQMQISGLQVVAW
ncbi:unnamed protein product [Urochloa decumbens]|uniref:Secreted protein n=1 Tax=Urochloa decumbens TaxID=240449 RepID=A0ABC8ZTR9_9POAL